MWWALWGLSSAFAADCPLSVTAPEEELAVYTPLETSRGIRALPRASLLRGGSSESCPSGSWVEVLATPWFYRVSELDPALPGDSGCVASTDIEPAMERQFLVLASPPEHPASAHLAGEVLGSVEESTSCESDSVAFGGVEYPVSSVPWLQALSVEQASQLEVLQAGWVSRYGPSLRGRVWLSDWGTMSMPMLRYADSSELEAEWERESLVSPSQRERAIHAVGPGSVWLHFLGSDAPYSDSWARPETVEALADLAQGWLAYCAHQMPAARSRCVLQLGDLAWYNTRRPDPLGHAEHYAGRCVDLRLFRQDESHYEAWWNRGDDRPDRGTPYDRNLTQEFVTFAYTYAQIELIYFNDPHVEGVEPSPGHDDHMHLCFRNAIESKNE